MNTESGNIKNFLFVIKDANYAQNFHKLCLECIQTDQTTLFITRKPFNLLTLLSEFELFKEQLKKCILMFFERIDDVIHKLLELHTWAMLPVLVVIDLHSYFEDYNQQNVSLVGLPVVSPMKSICLCVATLFNYMKSLEQRLTTIKPESSDGSKVLAHSVLLLGKKENILKESQLELLINLYFYTESAFDDYNEMKRRIFDTWT